MSRPLADSISAAEFREELFWGGRRRSTEPHVVPCPPGVTPGSPRARTARVLERCEQDWDGDWGVFRESLNPRAKN